MATSDDPRIKFGLSCPAGGGFYICQDSSTRFIGCCDVDPCTADLDGECPTAKLFDASFSAASGVKFAAQSCAEPWNSSIWYTCADARPPFLGCCMNNPCNNGCLPGHLVPAVLSEDMKNASQLMLPRTTTTSSSTGTGTGLPTGTESSGASSPTATDMGSEGGVGGEGSKKSHTGLIVGITMAGVVVLLAVVGVYLWIRRREQARQMNEMEQTVDDGPSGDTRASKGFFQGGLFRTSPTTESSPPAEKGAFPPADSNVTSHNPQGNTFSPSASENFHSPHLSQLSELEGSSGIIRALHPNLAEAYRGFDGREP
ncbi:hypothetical protein HD806DRAFT_536382 [Xylariaceae sp. AK1471]|nr:hypothetical protein HD806DRAFT_536382 [Xylariaceae sp. AK1471]